MIEPLPWERLGRGPGTARNTSSFLFHHQPSALRPTSLTSATRRTGTLSISTHLILEAEHEGLEVDVENHGSHVFGDLRKRGPHENPGVVKGYMESSECFHRDVHHLLAVFFLTSDGWRDMYVYILGEDYSPLICVAIDELKTKCTAHNLSFNLVNSTKSWIARFLIRKIGKIDDIPGHRPSRKYCNPRFIPIARCYNLTAKRAAYATARLPVGG